MAKKDFKGNPAMSFISPESIAKVDGIQAAESITPKGGTRKAPEGYKPNAEYIELKSRRVQILVQPTLHKDAKAAAARLGISLNDFIHRAVQEATYNSTVQDQIKKEIER